MIYLILIGWIIIGWMLSFVPFDTYSLAGSFEYLNPLFLYKYHNTLNWFGIMCLALFYNLLCPLITIAYWFYKLCTVGRK